MAILFRHFLPPMPPSNEPLAAAGCYAGLRAAGRWTPGLCLLLGAAPNSKCCKAADPMLMM
eukprot:274357-Chlamydomonas_euryale.AAC.9